MSTSYLLPVLRILQGYTISVISYENLHIHVFPWFQQHKARALKSLAKSPTLRFILDGQATKVWHCLLCFNLTQVNIVYINLKFYLYPWHCMRLLLAVLMAILSRYLSTSSFWILCIGFFSHPKIFRSLLKISFSHILFSRIHW